MAPTAKRQAQLAALLIERRRELQTDVQNRIRDGRADRAAEGLDDLEHSEADIQEALTFALLQMQAETLARIDAALVRLEAGQYGACFECRRPISKERLRALPFATRCHACEGSRERTQDLNERTGQRRQVFSIFPDQTRR